MARVNFTDYDCLLIVVLSYNDRGFIYAKDGIYRPDDNLWGRFDDDKCITLVGKPKLFFIQACSISDAVSFEWKRDQGIPYDLSFTTPIREDFLIVFSKIPGKKNVYINMYYCFKYLYSVRQENVLRADQNWSGFSHLHTCPPIVFPPRLSSDPRSVIMRDGDDDATGGYCLLSCY